MVLKPAACAARHLRSPATISNVLPTGRTTIGCSKPTSFREKANSSKSASSKTVLGCFGFGTI